MLKNYNGNRINWYNYGEDYDVRNFDYYFFDMDGDGAPELGVVDQMNLKDIFKYEKEMDRFILWYSMEQPWDQLIGSRKVMWYHYGNTCIQSEFYQLDKDGNEECLTFCAFTPNSVYVYIVGLPDYADESKELEVTEDMKKQGIYERTTGHWYFRINEKQFQKLEERYLKAYEEAEEKLEEVTFTYEELFGDVTGEN